MSFVPKRTLSLAVSIVFFTQTVCLGQLPDRSFLSEPGDAGPKLSQSGAVLKHSRIEIPYELGEITARFENPQNKTFLIQVQDAHGCYEAQKNIARIAEYLHKTYGINILFLEGSAGELDPGLFDFFEDARLNLEVADDLMKEGEFTGAEMALLENASNEEKFRAYGIEAEALYREDLRLFRDVLGRKAVSDDFLKAAGERLDTIGSRILSNRLRDFIREWRRWRETQEDLMRFLGVLYRQSLETLGLDLKDPKNQGDYPSLVRYFNLKEAEGGQDPQKVKGERESFFRFLEGRIDAKLFEEISEIGKTDRSGEKENLRFLLEKIAGQLLPEKIELPDFPNFYAWLRFRILESEIRSEDLFNEIERATESVLGKMAGSGPEERFVALLEDKFTLEKLLSLELTRAQYERIRSRIADLNPVRFWERLHALDTDLGAPFVDGKLGKTFGGAEEFYRLAEEREAYFIEKVLTLLNGRKNPNSILVTGGFHTEGLERKLRAEGISYVSIRPRIREIGNSQEVYLGAILGVGTHFAESQINIVPALTGLGEQEKLGWDREERSERIVNAVRQIWARRPLAGINLKNAYLAEAASLGGDETQKLAALARDIFSGLKAEGNYLEIQERATHPYHPDFTEIDRFVSNALRTRELTGTKDAIMDRVVYLVREDQIAPSSGGELRKVNPSADPKIRAALFDLDGTLVDTLGIGGLVHGYLYHYIVNDGLEEPTEEEMRPGKEFLNRTMGTLILKQIQMLLQMARDNGKSDEALRDHLIQILSRIEPLSQAERDLLERIPQIFSEPGLSLPDGLAQGYATMALLVQIHEAKRRNPQLFNGVRRTLERLKEFNIPVFLATGNMRLWAEFLVDEFKLRDYFTEIFGGETDGSDRFLHGKEDMLLYVKERLGLGGDNELVLFGDGHGDMAATKPETHPNRFIGVGISGGDEALAGKLTSSGADFLIPDFEKFLLYWNALGFPKEPLVSGESLGKLSRDIFGLLRKRMDYLNIHEYATRPGNSDYSAISEFVTRILTAESFPGSIDEVIAQVVDLVKTDREDPAPGNEFKKVNPDAVPEIRAVLFDLDGTLVDSLWMHEVTFGTLWHYIVNGTNLSPAEAELRRGEEFLQSVSKLHLIAQVEAMIDLATSKGRSEELLWGNLIRLGDSYGIGPEIEKISGFKELSLKGKLMQGYYWLYSAIASSVARQNLPRLFPGAERVLRRLQEFNIPVYVGTLSHQALADYEVQGNGIGKYFVEVYGSVNDDISPFEDGKLDVLRHIKRQHGLERDAQITIIGDTRGDMKASKSGDGRESFIGIGVTQRKEGQAERLAEGGADFIIPDLEKFLLYWDALGFPKEPLPIASSLGDETALKHIIGTQSVAEAVDAIDEMIAVITARRAAIALETWAGRGLGQFAVNETYPSDARKIREIARRLKERGRLLLYQEYEARVRAYWTGYVANKVVPLYDSVSEDPALLELSLEEKMDRFDEIPYLRQLGKRHLIFIKTIASYFQMRLSGSELFVTASSFFEIAEVLQMLLRLENEHSPESIRAVQIAPEAAGILESRGFLHDFAHVARAVPFFEFIRDKFLEAGYVGADLSRVSDEMYRFRSDFRAIHGIYRHVNLEQKDLHVRLILEVGDLIREGISAYRDSVKLMRQPETVNFIDSDDVESYCQAAETSLEILRKLQEGVDAFIAGKIPEKKPFDIRHSVQTVADFFFREDLPTLPHFELELPEELATAFGDEHGIDRVWLNLIKNALDATEVPSTQQNENTIRVKVELSGGEIVTRVSDTGSGIPPEILARIWEPDFTTKGANGTGLGLPVAKQIVEQFGGTISVESEAGKGTTFTVRLPLYVETAASLGQGNIGFLINDLNYHLNAPTGLRVDWETKSFGKASGTLELNTNDDLLRVFCHVNPGWAKQYPNLDPLTNPANHRGLYLKSPIGSFGQLILEFHSLPVWDEARPREKNFMPVLLIREVQPSDGLRAIKDPKHRRQLDAWREKTLQAVLAWAKSNGVEVFASASELINELHPDLSEFEVRTNYELPFQNGDWQTILIPTRFLKDEENDLYGFVPDLMLESGEEYPWHVYTGNRSFPMLQENASSLGDLSEREDRARAAALEKYEGLYARLMAAGEYPDAGGLAKVLRGFRTLPGGGYVTREFEDGIYTSIFRIHDQSTIGEARLEFRSFVDEIADVFPPEQRDQIKVWEVENDNAHVSAVVFQEANALLKAPAPRLTEEDKGNLRGLLDEMARETHPVSLHFVGYGLGPDGGFIRLYADLSGRLFDFCERLRIRAEEITEGRTSSRPKGLISMTVGRILSLPYSEDAQIAERQKAEVMKRVRARGEAYHRQWIENLAPGTPPALTIQGITWLNESQWLTTKGREPDRYFPFGATGASLGERKAGKAAWTRASVPAGSDLTAKEIQSLGDYTEAFLGKNKPVFQQNREEIRDTLLDSRRLAFALRSNGPEAYRDYARFHTDFLNQLDPAFVARIFAPKLLSGERGRKILDFLVGKMSRAEGLTPAETEFFRGLRPDEDLANQGVSVARVVDYSSGRGWDEGTIVLKITLLRNGRQFTFFLKGLGSGEVSLKRAKKKQIGKYEVFFFELAKLLGLNSIQSAYFAEEEDPRMQGFTLMQEIRAPTTGILFDNDPKNLHFRLREEFVPYRVQLISEFAQFAALSDLFCKIDRKIIRNRRPQFSSNYMIDEDRLKQGLPALYAIDHLWLFNSDIAEVIEDIELGGEGEIGILCSLEEFNNPEGRTALLAEYERAYRTYWEALQSRMPQIENLVVEIFGEGSLEHQRFLEFKQMDPEEKLRRQEEALLRFVERRDSGASLGEGIPAEAEQYAEEHRRDISAILFVAEKYAGRILYLPDADQAVFSWFSGRLGLGGTVGKEIGKEFEAFNVSSDRLWQYLRARIPDAVGGPEGSIPMLLDEGVFEETDPEAVAQKVALAMRSGDLLAVLWNGDRKPKFVSELYRISGGRKFRVKDLMVKRMTGASVDKLTKGYDVPVMWIGSLTREEMEISFRQGDKVKLNLKILADYGIDPAQIVTLLRQIADYPALREKLFLEAGFTPREGYWEVGSGFVNLIQSIYQAQAAQQAIKTAA